MKSQIGLISYGADRPTSGVPRYTQELISALYKNKVPLTVLHAGRSAFKQNGMVPLWGAARAPGLLTLGQVEIAWIAKRCDLALIHDPTGLIPLAASSARRVATIHDLIPYVHPENSTKMDWMIYHFWLPFVVKNLDGIITVSSHSKADIVRCLRVNPDRVTVIPEGVDWRYRPIEPWEVQRVLERHAISFPYILFVSAVEPRKKRKNLPRLLEAFARFLKWSKRWRLVIVGNRRKSYPPVEETLERLELKPHVHFTGFVPEEDLPALYNGASLFIYPSLYEGFGLPILEAMACGTPAVTSNTSSLPEVAGEAAILVDPYDSEAMLEAMQKVLSDPGLAAELRSKGLTRAQGFRWERTARETISVYESLLDQRMI